MVCRVDRVSCWNDKLVRALNMDGKEGGMCVSGGYGNLCFYKKIKR